MNYISQERFKALTKSAGKAPTNPIRKAMPTTVLPVDGDSRQLQFVISTNAVDRVGDVVDQAGWDLDAYRQNAVVLFEHNHEQLVGKCLSIEVEGDALIAVAEFLPADNPQWGALAEGVYQALRGGFLKATSVGFMVEDWEWASDDSDGQIITRSQLLEFSIVSVPCNPECLIIEDAPSEAPQAEPEADNASNAVAQERSASELNTGAITRQRMKMLIACIGN